MDDDENGDDDNGDDDRIKQCYTWKYLLDIITQRAKWGSCSIDKKRIGRWVINLDLT